jgi:transposase-like protein
MTIHLKLPSVQSEPRSRPAACLVCGHWHLQRHGSVDKPIRDPHLRQVRVHRYRCGHCQHTFRHYPTGVTAADHSQRLVALLAVLWALGLSLRRTALVLALLGMPTSFVSVWRAVQSVGAALRRIPAGRVTVLGVDGSGMRLAGATAGVVVAVDIGTGQVLDLVLADERDPTVLQSWLRPLVEAHGIEVLVTDDLASYAVTAEQLGVARQGCRFHLARWVGRRLRELDTALGPEYRPVLQRLRVMLDRLEADGDRQLLELWQALRTVPHPRDGPRSAEVRLWRLLAWLSERWSRYRLCARRADVPPTNNRSEQAIGRIKVRSRTVRGYKSEAGLLNGSTLASVVGTGRDLDLQSLMGTPVH